MRHFVSGILYYDRRDRRVSFLRTHRFPPVSRQFKLEHRRDRYRFAAACNIQMSTKSVTISGWYLKSIVLHIVADVYA